jgi:ribonuclease D
VAALADEHNVPTENLLHPDAVRRLSWTPPDTLSAGAIEGELSRYGARPWQVELTAAAITGALARLDEKDQP